MTSLVRERVPGRHNSRMRLDGHSLEVVSITIVRHALRALP